LFFISGFAGFLLVDAVSVWDKWLIISGFFGILLMVLLIGIQHFRSV
jgi:hypothetical protein